RCHPPLALPSVPTRRSSDLINNYLLEHKAVADYVRSNGPGKAIFLMFDEKTEELAQELGLEVCLPPARLRNDLDDKLITTRVAEDRKSTRLNSSHVSISYAV